jgi:hypothetical protein
MWARTGLVVVAMLAVDVAVMPTAAAQTTAAQAEQLFRDGKKLMEQKQYGEACDAFQASQRLDPTVNTLANLADCREKNGQLASAWGLFLDLARQLRGDAKQSRLLQTATDRAAKLEPRLSYLIINVPDEARIEGLSITRNGQTVESAQWNRAIPVDGGEHIVEAKAPGHEAWSTKVLVNVEHDKDSVDVPRFKEMALPDPDPVEPMGEVTTPIEPGGAPTRMTGRRKVALALGVGGGVVLGAAGYFELAARSSYDDAAMTSQTQARRDEKLDAANRQRGIAVGAAIAGGALIGAAAYLWITGAARPGDGADRRSVWLVPSVAPGQIGVAIGGAL